MSVRLLEMVPNFSEGRDAVVVREIADLIEAAGADVLDIHMDADHNRSVITAVGEPARIEDAAVAAVGAAKARIDLARHVGIHPRIGALDVLPLVPVVGLSMVEARLSARAVGARIVREHDVPIFYYGAASEPSGRTLAELRRGGYERLVQGWPVGRQPDGLPADWPHPGAHPKAGATCVGARGVLLAWNIWCDGVDLSRAKAIAATVRESNGGLPGVRAMAFDLGARGMQISMNLEDPETMPPMRVFEVLEQQLAEVGGRVVRTEVVGLVPDPLVTSAAMDRLRLEPGAESRLLSRRLLQYLGGRDAQPPSSARRGK